MVLYEGKSAKSRPGATPTFKEMAIRSPPAHALKRIWLRESGKDDDLSDGGCKLCAHSIPI
jgi:hypothetical protein